MASLESNCLFAGASAPLSTLLKLLAILLLVDVGAAADLDYCNKFGANHTMCLFKPKACAPGKSILSTCNLNCTGKQHVLRLHNMYRMRLADGVVDGQPQAANMLSMRWNDKLAEVAQRWSEQCLFQHDIERRIDGYFCSGQNVAVRWTWTTSLNVSSHCAPDFSPGIEAWFNEVKLFPSSDHTPFKFSQSTGHYTQMAWASTGEVGCGCTCYSDVQQNVYARLYVCNYAPCGNVAGSSMYQKGKPKCSKEDGLQFSKLYTKSLCEPKNSNFPDIPGCFGASAISTTTSTTIRAPLPTSTAKPVSTTSKQNVSITKPTVSTTTAKIITSVKTTIASTQVATTIAKETSTTVKPITSTARAITISFKAIINNDVKTVTPNIAAITTTTENPKTKKTKKQKID